MLLLPHLEANQRETQLALVLDEAHTLPDRLERADVLARLLPQLSEEAVKPVKDELAELAESLPDGITKVNVLAALVPFGASREEVLERARAVVDKLEDGQERGRAQVVLL